MCYIGNALYLPLGKADKGVWQMLVLTRKSGQQVVIDGNITLKVTRISGNRVTIGIDAPSDVRIVRGELAQEGVSTPTAQPLASCDPMVAARHS